MYSTLDSISRSRKNGVNENSLRNGQNELRYVNHSRKPNASFYGDELEALRAIRPGEEITHDYGWEWAGVS